MADEENVEVGCMGGRRVGRECCKVCSDLISGGCGGRVSVRCV